MDFTQLPVQINTLRLIKPRLKVYYPIVDGLPDQVKQKKLNDAILAEVSKSRTAKGDTVGVTPFLFGTRFLQENGGEQAYLLNINIRLH